MDTLLSTLGNEDVLILVAAFFATVFGFNTGITLAKGGR